MGNSYGGSIITDGLVLALDASTDRSYSDSGTVWKDLSGNGNDCTLTHEAIGTVSGSVNALSLDGSTNYITTPFTRVDFGLYYTINVWYKFNGSTTGGYAPLIGSDVGSTRFFVGKATGNTNIGVEDGTSTYEGGFATGTDAWDSTWRNIQYVYSSGSREVFLDGISVGSDFKSPSTIANSNEIVIGYEDEGAGYYFTGDYGHVSIYNKALTAKEVLQNYNATKGRFL